MELKHRRCCFKRSASSCLMTPMRIRSSRISSSASQSVGVVKPGIGELTSPIIPNAIKKPKKSKGFLSFLFRKRDNKIKKRDQLNVNHMPLEEPDVRKLIRLYCKHDSLYNPKNLYYGNKEIDEDCFNDMMRSFPGRSSLELRSCIEQLRILFEREYTIIEKARRNYGEKLTPSIRYYNEFLFLVPHLCIDFDKDLPSSGPSLLSTAKLPSTDLKNQMATTELLCHKLTNFTGFPLSAFPGNLMLKRLKKTNKNGEKKEVKTVDQQEEVTEPRNQGKETGNGQKNNDIEKMKEQNNDIEKMKEQNNDMEKMKEQNNDMEKMKEHDEQELKEEEDQETKVKFSPSLQQKSLKSSEADNSQNKLSSKISTQSSYYANEKDLTTTDLSSPENRETISQSSQKPSACPWRPENSPCVPQCQEAVSKSSQSPLPCAPCVSGYRAELTESSPEPVVMIENKTISQFHNNQQVQMLCDMIRTELTTAPDFIYFDAKWRIIEILREVHKRQLVHQKAIPQHNNKRPIPPQKRLCLEPNLMTKNQKCKSDKNGQEQGPSRICNHHKCQYCCRHNN
ncbi:uncharacterized protein LOC121529673 [Drosophila eugracilis]|uniref:uncharacterized protein LOC121529673 n=1 Tax=Drosophila eugracilis TaxID=29029 RepID=UPI001BDA92EF|nr:uncharacterized protein LOC121529673 [Drosophila eugracilis]